MLESTSAAAAINAGDALLSDAQLAAHGSTSTIARDGYVLQFTHLSKRAFSKNS
jgi:hypothetical protein